jgi:(E)-4-hydroxy-3-methylbut-2-enyl-diphosphate synthase
MTNTPTLDTKATVEQVKRVIDAGADYVRITTPAVRDAENLAGIKKLLNDSGYSNPLVADVHFNPSVAEVAARLVEKVRINPGNYVDKKKFEHLSFTEKAYESEIERIHQRVAPLLKICKEYGTAIRIGVNHGSLSDRIMSRYGDTPEGMVESAMEFLRIFESEGFRQTVISMKSSNTRVMVYSTRLLIKKMQLEGMYYPVHLGVTEAGEGEDGIIKSAVGIGTLLAEGIGETIRVSLTGDPEQEIPVARSIVTYFTDRHKTKSFTSDLSIPDSSCEYHRRQSKGMDGIGGAFSTKVLVSNPQGEPISNRSVEDVVFSDEQDALDRFSSEESSNQAGKPIVIHSQSDHTPSELRKGIERLEQSGNISPVVVRKKYSESCRELFQIKAACDFGPLLIDGLVDGIWLENDRFPAEDVYQTSLNLLQASRLRMSKTEYISCPSCGRTLFDLSATTAKIRKRTSHLKHLKIGIMGCIVNGPGEMADADYGYVGTGPGKITLYKSKDIVKRNIPENEAVDELISVIKSNGDWVEP